MYAPLRLATRRSQASLWHPNTALATLDDPTLSHVNVQRAGCEGQRMELQQAMGQQERELRARQSASSAP